MILLLPVEASLLEDTIQRADWHVQPRTFMPHDAAASVILQQEFPPDSSNYFLVIFQVPEVMAGLAG